MNHNHNKRSWLRRGGFSAGVAAFFILSGCRSGNKESAAIPAENVAPAQAEARRPAVEPITLVGPRSQEDMEECFAIPKNVTFNPASVPAPKDNAPVAHAGPVAVGAGWDVKLARDWRYIVIHHSASPTGSAASFDRAHKARGWDGLGYDFVIGNGQGSGDGQVEVGYRWSQQLRGAHAGNIDYNEHGIGICLVGNFEFERPTAKQMESLRNLVRFLQSKTGIPAASIIGHDHVPGKDTQCPGRLFNMAGFRASMNNGKEVAADTRPVPMSTAKPAAAATKRAIMP
ncbi:MAG: N-acetylmuramoyl-L-alanine amidase [Planctomycetota bacterium]|nr:N-acetylmuramoyl-L-alanine amidase [Planctomycetota bacterium]